MKTVRELAAQPGWSGIERPRFSPGLLLEAEDLNAGVDYARDTMRLLVRSLFGCGVVCGLEVSAHLGCNREHLTVIVQPGLALDCTGSVIHIPKAVSVKVDAECGNYPDRVWVSVHYSEKCSRTRDVSSSPDDEIERVSTRSAEGYVLRIHAARPEDACACVPTEADVVTDPAPTSASTAPPPVVTPPAAAPPCDCYEPHNQGKCACDCGCGGVLLAYISVPKESKEGDLPVSHSYRRNIRPVLTGFLPCINPAKKGDDGKPDTTTPNNG